MKPTPEEQILALLPELDRPALMRVMQAIVDELAKDQPPAMPQGQPMRPEAAPKTGDTDSFQQRFEDFKAGRG